MDIDKMKESWAQMSDQLEKSEANNRDAIKKLLSTKARSSYDKVRNQEKMGAYLGTVVFLIFAIFFLTGRLQHWYSFVIIEVIVSAVTACSFYALSQLPATSSPGIGLTSMMRGINKYKKVVAIYKPLMVLVIGLAIYIFFFENRGFDSNTYYQAIFWLTIAFIVGVATFGAARLKRQIDEANDDIRELQNFIDE